MHLTLYSHVPACSLAEMPGLLLSTWGWRFTCNEWYPSAINVGITPTTAAVTCNFPTDAYKWSLHWSNQQLQQVYVQCSTYPRLGTVHYILIVFIAVQWCPFIQTLQISIVYLASVHAILVGCIWRVHCRCTYIIIITILYSSSSIYDMYISYY